MSTKSSNVDFEAIQPSRNERNRRLGVDCNDKLVWKHWSLGGEYPRVLEIRNALQQTQVIEYSLPENKSTYFVEFPRPVSLAPGMVFQLEIKFRPIERINYYDRIEIKTKRGSFFVFLESLLPYVAIDVEKNVDWGFCPVKESTERTITLRNKGTMPYEFNWQAQPPFSVSPCVGKMEPNASQILKVVFHPIEASSFVATAICRVRGEEDEEDQITKIRLSGTGKYPYIQSKITDMDFGCVNTGDSLQQILTVENKSLVPGRFTIQKTDVDLESCFSFQPTRGEIAPESSVAIRVVYKPLTTGTFSCDTFKIGTPGGNALSLRCRGQATGAELTLGVKSLNFDNQEIGLVVEKHFKITNHSWRAAKYQWVGLQPGCAFEFAVPFGSIPPRDKVHKGTATCTIRFRPTEAINYYRRVYCLINDHSTVLYVDLLGTGYCEKEKKRPAPFTQRQVDLHWGRFNAGLGKATPDEIEAALEPSEEVEAASPGDFEESQMRETMFTTMNTQRFDQPQPLQLWKDLFTPSSDAMVLPFSLDEPELNFGQSMKMKGGDARPIHVRNNTSAKATAVWCCPTSGVWDVQPRSADIKPFSSTPFKVLFKPTVSNRFSHATLECYVFFKTMRSFRLVNEVSFIPPTCLLLEAHGHTYPPMGFFSPIADLSRDRITFPACHPSASIYQTMMINNKAEQPLHYTIVIDPAVSQHEEEQKRIRAKNLDEDGFPIAPPDELESPVIADSGRRVFSCHPSSGVVPPGGHQLVAFRFQPHMATLYRAHARCRLNQIDSSTQKITLLGQSFNPRLLLADDGSLFFKPTHVGILVSRQYMIENPSRIGLTFDWQVPNRYRDVISIEPTSGMMRGNERLKIKVTFRPSEQKKYMLKIPCNCNVVGMDDELTAKYRTSLAVFGEGVVGGLTIEPSSLDFATVRIGSCETRQLTMFNSTSCDVPFALGYVLTDSASQSEDDGTLVEFSVKEGVLPCRAHLSVNVKFSPKARESYRVVIFCKLIRSGVAKLQDTLKVIDLPDSPTATQLGMKGGHDLSTNFEEELSTLPQCEITGSGAYPVLAITDIRAIRTSKAHLWEQFSINQINDAITEELTDVDKNRTEFSIQRLIEQAPMFTLDFAAGAVGSHPYVVFMEVTNTTAMAMQFSFRFPNDTDLQPEHWWPDDVHTEDERWREMILDNNLFSIEPRKGSLPAGGSMCVRLTYQHKFAGLHILPVLLDIQEGKRLCLKLTGRSLRQNERHLHFINNTHAFQPVAIGDADPPVQYYELRNLSSDLVQYKLDSTALQKLQQDNYNFPVFKCENPEGVIAAQDSVWLRWLFTPLETKRYVMDCSIHIQSDGKVLHAYSVQFQAEGYHGRKVSQENLVEMKANEFSKLSDKPKLVIPALPICLSIDVLRFGRVPYHSINRRLVVLKNTSLTDTYSYIWNTALPYSNAEISVSPVKGSLAPGEHQVCKMTFISGSVTQILDMNVDCIVLNTTLRNERDAERQKYEDEMFAAENPEEDIVYSHCETRLSATQSVAGNSTLKFKNGSFISQKRCKRPVHDAGHGGTYRSPMATIIRHQDIMAEEDEPRNGQEMMWVDIKPVFLSMRVQARVLSTEQFKETQLEDMHGAWFPALTLQQQHVEGPYPALLAPVAETLTNRPASRALAEGLLLAERDGTEEEQAEFRQRYQQVLDWQSHSQPQTLPEPEPEELPEMQASPTQTAVYTNLLVDLLREIVHDPEVVEAYETLHSERVPYYCEVASTPRASRPGSAVASARASLLSAQAVTSRQLDGGAAPQIGTPPPVQKAPSPETASPKAPTPPSMLKSPTPPSGLPTPKPPSIQSPSGTPAMGAEAQVAADAEVAEVTSKPSSGRTYLESVMKARLAEKEETDKRRTLQNGWFQNAVEEVLESLSFEIMEDAAQNKLNLLTTSTSGKLNRRSKRASPPPSRSL